MTRLPDQWSSWLPAIVAIAIAIALVLGAWAALRVRSWLERRQRVRRSRRAESGEHRARVWLLKNGFTIVGEQQSLICEMRVNGERVEYAVCADYLVERGGERAVVEVKTGGAANPSTPNTRRQIYEYAAAYGVDRVYMFDGDESTLHEIEFQTAPPRHVAPPSRVAAWQVGFIGGVIVTALLAWMLARAAG